MKKVLIIMGTSRSDGHTKNGVDLLRESNESELVDLSDVDISYYDYEHKNSADDFLNIANKMQAADTIVFATPVYWYSMSAQLKTFFDRLSDLLNIRKSIGKSLKSKTVYLISCGSDSEPPKGFEIPFRRTAKYFDMAFKGMYYWQTKEGEVLPASTKNEIKEIANVIFGT